MQFGHTDGTIQQADRRNAFQFAPTTCSIALSQKGQDANTVADGYDFDVGNIANDLEVHQELLYLRHNPMS